MCAVSDCECGRRWGARAQAERCPPPRVPLALYPPIAAQEDTLPVPVRWLVAGSESALIYVLRIVSRSCSATQGDKAASHCLPVPFGPLPLLAGGAERCLSTSSTASVLLAATRGRACGGVSNRRTRSASCLPRPVFCLFSCVPLLCPPCEFRAPGLSPCLRLNYCATTLC